MALDSTTNQLLFRCDATGKHQEEDEEEKQEEAARLASVTEMIVQFYQYWMACLH